MSKTQRLRMRELTTPSHCCELTPAPPLSAAKTAFTHPRTVFFSLGFLLLNGFLAWLYTVDCVRIALQIRCVRGFFLHNRTIENILFTIQIVAQYTTKYSYLLIFIYLLTKQASALITVSF